MPLFSQSTASGIESGDTGICGRSDQNLVGGDLAFPGFWRLSLIEYIRQLLPIRFRLEPLQIVRELRVKPNQDARVIVLNPLNDALRSGFRGGSRDAIETLERFSST
jgi:hypothetical protein